MIGTHRGNLPNVWYVMVCYDMQESNTRLGFPIFITKLFRRLASHWNIVSGEACYSTQREGERRNGLYTVACCDQIASKVDHFMLSGLEIFPKVDDFMLSGSIFIPRYIYPCLYDPCLDFLPLQQKPTSGNQNYLCHCSSARGNLVPWCCFGKSRSFVLFCSSSSLVWVLFWRCCCFCGVTHHCISSVLEVSVLPSVPAISLFQRYIKAWHTKRWTQGEGSRECCLRLLDEWGAPLAGSAAREEFKRFAIESDLVWLAQMARQYEVFCWGQ